MRKFYERPIVEIETIECEKGFVDSWDSDTFDVESGTSNGEYDAWI